MAGYYPYLVASLPSLVFGGAPPFTFDRFFQACDGFIDDRSTAVLRVLDRQEDILSYAGGNATLRAWREFETGLRNEIVKIRAVRRKTDAGRYLRPGDGSGDGETSLMHSALHAHRQAALLSSEKALDEARWRKLDELAFGHYFDIDRLIIYGLKLGILLRWELIGTADKAGLLSRVLQEPAGENMLTRGQT